VDAVVLSILSAALFGGMTVALRPALARGVNPALGAFWTVLPAFAVVLVAAVIRFEWDVAGLWPYAIAGLLSPALSQTLFTFGVREAGPARTSVAVGTAPLFSVVIALVFLDEPVVAGVLAGAIAIVAGGLLLVGERERPVHVRRVGIALALASTIAFATRDNFVRWLAVDSDVSPELAAAAALGCGVLAIGASVLLTQRAIAVAPLRLLLAPGLMFGLSYVCLFEAFYRGRVTVVSPLVATESLWGVALSALFLHRVEVVGRRLLLGALLIVAGGILIGLFR
jgi:drug/metabolite transporter (DMT)-like permease